MEGATQNQQPPARRAVHPGRVAAGLIFITLGLLAFVNQSGLFDVDTNKLFPGLLIAMFGMLRLTGAGRRHHDTRGWRNLIDGLWLLTIGAWLMANAVHAFGMTYAASWPVLLIAGGVFITARGWGR